MSLTSEERCLSIDPAPSPGIFAIVFATLLLVASKAQASEVIYWDNYEA